VSHRAEDSQESVDDPVLKNGITVSVRFVPHGLILLLSADLTYGQPLGVVGLGGGEEGVKRVEGRDDESSNIDEKLASDVEEDQGEVEDTKTKDDVDLGDAGLLLKLVELGVLGKLSGEVIVSTAISCSSTSAVST
jgi:hypothetical protein